jgi:hypothetical protein
MHAPVSVELAAQAFDETSAQRGGERDRACEPDETAADHNDIRCS